MVKASSEATPNPGPKFGPGVKFGPDTAWINTEGRGEGAGPCNALICSVQLFLCKCSKYTMQSISIEREVQAMLLFPRSRGKRFAIGKLMEEGKTLKQAEEIILKGDKNRSRLVKQWTAGGAYPYGDKDKPTGDSFLDDVGAFHIDSAAITQKPLQTANALQINWNDPVLTDKLKALIREALREQSTAMQTAHTDIKPSRKLWRTGKNVSPVSFRIQTELLRRARAKLQETYQGHMSLNHFIELTLWRLVGEPEDLLEPERYNT